MSLSSPRRDILLQLVQCSEIKLFLLTCVARMFVLMAMLFSYAVLPKLINSELLFDTGGLLHSDMGDHWGFLDFPRNWDGVHFFHIAKHGYSHENNCVFFPLIPFLVWVISWLDKQIIPASLAVLPVSFQFALVNVLLGGLAAVFLRRLTVLTLLCPTLMNSFGNVGGTWLDELPLPPQPRWTQKDNTKEEDTKLRLQREVGATLLMWIMSPSAVFTVVVYTEAIFSLLTFVGVYLLALPCKTSSKVMVAVTEVGAVFCFTLAGFARSNAFIYIGYLLYPIFLQMFFFNTYRRRHIRHHGESSSLRRWPSVLRCVVIVFECILICAPYLLMNYFCYYRFVPLWDPLTRNKIGGRFWSFYAWMQKRYWNVSFLSSYSLRNMPNVFIGTPVVFFTLRGVFLFYLCPLLTKTTTSSLQRNDIDTNKSADLKKTNKKVQHGYFFNFYYFVESVFQSSNILCLVALILFGLCFVHVNVVNRFIMSSPALYWIWARQIVWDPWGGCTVVMLRFFAVWTFIGIFFFPNGMPWT